MSAPEKPSWNNRHAIEVGDSGAGALPRITETRYFRNEHYEIPARMVADNPAVLSFRNCKACHRGAIEVVYNEHRVRIPGFDRGRIEWTQVALCVEADRDTG